jgi:hypothetical protein
MYTNEDYFLYSLKKHTNQCLLVYISYNLHAKGDNLTLNIKLPPFFEESVISSNHKKLHCCNLNCIVMKIVFIYSLKKHMI